MTFRALPAVQMTNDFCDEAIEITSFPYSVAIDNNLATADLPAPLCSGNPNPVNLGYSIYFTFTPTASGTLTVVNHDILYASSALVLFTGTCSSLQVDACKLYASNDTSVPLTAQVQAGTTYILAVGRNGGGGGINQLEMTLAVSCAADFNGDHIRDVADLFGYINAWLAKTPNADFNHDSLVDVADLFGFINAWLAGC